MRIGWEVEGDGSNWVMGLYGGLVGFRRVGYLGMICIPKSYPLIPLTTYREGTWGGTWGSNSTTRKCVCEEEWYCCCIHILVF
jgi:hypothetical protein